MQQLQCRFLLMPILVLFAYIAKAQDSTMSKLPANYLTQISLRATSLEKKINKTSSKAILALQKKEDNIRRKLQRLDSKKAKEVFGDANEKYNALKQTLQQPASLSQYIPYLDTLKTSIKFLEGNKGLLSHAKGSKGTLSNSFSKVKDLEGSLAKTEQLQQFIRERKAYLKSQLTNLPFAKKLKQINKQAYYYSAQINEYKEALKGPKKLERKAMELLSKTQAFQKFMRKNSQLASMFRLPGGAHNVDNTAALQGLQTRASVNAMIQDRIGNDANAQALFQQNVRDAQSQLSSLKDKASQYASGAYGNSSSDMDVPDFKPNNQKTKSFLERLEYGGNVQSQKARHFFPVTSDIGLSIGYKLNDKSVIGLGASYKLGLGKGWNHISVSHQGVGLRSYVDYKLKGSIFLSGGYEQNYRTAFASIEELKNQSAWQSSGLVGLSKKYSVSKKMKGSVQLLWDFLSYQEVPKTQAVLFRVGYSLK